ncbi:MAG: CocE/NonD family hydrolase [Alphaproteobacteria bacterium]|nr:CocE/NonD family hydrolase [Alphaproteobacteria bacterium]
MRIDWDVPIAMDDGVVLRADVFRPASSGKVPAIVTYGPYAKGLAFQDGYRTAWDIMAVNHPDVTRGSSNRYQNWEVVDPEKWVPDGYACVRIDSRGTGRSPGYIDHFSPRETQDFHDCVEWVARSASVGCTATVSRRRAMPASSACWSCSRSRSVYASACSASRAMPISSAKWWCRRRQ